MNVPIVSFTRPPAEVNAFYREVLRRIGELPGVERVALGTAVPWRDPGFFAAQFSVEGYAKANGEEDPRAQFRTVSPGFFASLGVPIVAGRDFTEGDRQDAEKVVIVSESLARRMFPGQDAVNRALMWTDPVTEFIGVSKNGRRIVGVAADVDDENVVPEPTMTVYHPFEQEMQRRPAVRAREDRSLRARHADHEDRAAHLGRPAGGARRHARRHPRRSAGAGAAERVRVRRLLRASRCSSRSSAWPACWRSRSARARASSASGWRSGRRRGTCSRAC